MHDECTRLSEQLRAADAAARALAAEALCRLGPLASAAAVPLLLALADEDDRVRQWAHAALEDLGPPRPADRTVLADLLGHDSSDIGVWAATLLGRLGDSAGRQAVGALASALDHGRALPVRQQSAWALGRMGSAARDALPALAAAARDGDPRLRRLSQGAIDSACRGAD